MLLELGAAHVLTTEVLLARGAEDERIAVLSRFSVAVVRSSTGAGGEGAAAWQQGSLVERACSSFALAGQGNFVREGAKPPPRQVR